MMMHVKRKTIYKINLLIKFYIRVYWLYTSWFQIINTTKTENNNNDNLNTAADAPADFLYDHP